MRSSLAHYGPCTDRFHGTKSPVFCNGTDHFCFPSNRACSLDIMSDTKEQDHMTSKSTFFSCEKIFCHISKKAAGISSFCCFAAMSAVDLGQEISLSDRYFLLLQATIKGSKVLRAQVAERTEKEEDVNRLTVKL